MRRTPKVVNKLGELHLLTIIKARICKPFKEPRNRFPAWRAGTTTLFDVSARPTRFLGSLNVYEFGLSSFPCCKIIFSGYSGEPAAGAGGCTTDGSTAEDPQPGRNRHLCPALTHAQLYRWANTVPRLPCGRNFGLFIRKWRLKIES